MKVIKNKNTKFSTYKPDRWLAMVVAILIMVIVPKMMFGYEQVQKPAYVGEVTWSSFIC